MWTQTDFLKERTLPLNDPYGDESRGVTVADGSDFSPTFWLASAPAQKVPLIYPMVIGSLLIFAYLIQQNLIFLVK